MLELMLPTAVSAAMIVGAVYDAATLTIPNWISAVLLALFPAVAVSAGLGWGEAGVHLGIGLAALFAGAALFGAGVVGGGDAKLFAAVSLYIGAQSLGIFIICVSIAGGAVALTVLAIRWVAMFGVGTNVGCLQHLIKGAGIPFGVAIAAGGLLVFPQTHLFLGLWQ